MSKFKLEAWLGLNSSEFSEGLGKVAGAITKFAGPAGKALAAVFAVAGAAVAAFAAKSVQEFAKFQHAFNEVLTLIPGASKKFIGALERDILSLSRTMGILPEEAVPALYQAISAGVPKENAIAFLQLASKAAIGGVTDLKTAVDGLTTVVNSYGTSNITAQKAADLMFQTVKLGKTTFEELSASLYNVLPIASSMGVSFEQVSAAMATLTAAGVPTAQATTQLRAAIQSLGAPTAVQRKTMEALGINVDKLKMLLTKKPDGLILAMNMLGQAANGDKEKLRKMVGSVEAIQAILGLTKNQAAIFTRNLNEMGLAAGSVDKAFETMEGGLKRHWDKIKATFVTTMIKIGDALAPLASMVIPLIAKIGNAFADLPWDKLKSFFEKFVSSLQRQMIPVFEQLQFAWDDLKEALIPLWELIKDAFIGTMENAKGGTGAFVKVLIMMMKMLELILTVVVPLINMFRELGKSQEHSGQASARSGGRLAKLIQLFIRFIEWVTKVIQALLDLYHAWGPNMSKMVSFEHAWDSLKAAVLGVIRRIVEKWQAAFDSIKHFIQGWKDRVLRIVEDFKNFFIEKVENIWNWFSEKFPGIAGFMTDAFNKAKEVFIGFYNKVKELLDGIWKAFEETFPGLAKIVTAVFDGIKAKLTGMFSWISKKAKWAANLYKKFTGKVVKLEEEASEKVRQTREKAQKELQAGMENEYLRRKEREEKLLKEKAEAEKEKTRIEKEAMQERMKNLSAALIMSGESAREVYGMSLEELEKAFKKTGEAGLNAMASYRKTNEEQIERMRKILLALGTEQEELSGKTNEQIRAMWLKSGEKGKQYYQMMIAHEQKLAAQEAARFNALTNNRIEDQERIARYRNMNMQQVIEAEKKRKADEKARLAAIKKQQEAMKKRQQKEQQYQQQHRQAITQHQQMQQQGHNASMQRVVQMSAAQKREQQFIMQRLQLQIRLGAQRNQVNEYNLKIINQTAQNMGIHLVQLRTGTQFMQRMWQFADAYAKALKEAAPHIEALRDASINLSGSNISIDSTINTTNIEAILNRMDKKLGSIDTSLKGKFVNQ